MKKIISLAIIAACFIQVGFAQKLVIGSKVPDFKGVEWKTAAPANSKSVLIDFYQSNNETCRELYPKLAEIHDKYSDKITIVILTREDSETIDELIKKDGSKYSFGYDPNGQVYNAFGVKFIPFSMLTDGKGNLIWQGNLSNIDDQAFKKLK